MSRLIMYSSYMKNDKKGNKKHSKNLMEYVATREGVDYEIKDKTLDVTEAQKVLINDLVNDYSFLKELDSYKTYLENKNTDNASKFLTSSFELIQDESKTKEVYLKYISERPRVQKFQEHGLFNDSVADLEKEIDNIKNHDGVVWTNIISLKREDAKNLGFDNAIAWKNLLAANMQEISKTMGIERKNLVWNAAFHNESHHPHVHLVIYSKNKREGFLNINGIEKIKSCLTNEIFKHELTPIKEEKTLNRDILKTEFQKELDKVYSKLISKDFKVNDKLAEEFLKLSSMINNKKLSYGYQPKEVKKQVDIVFKEVMKGKELSKIYSMYLDKHEELVGYYKDKPKTNKDITKNPDFRVIQNKILGAIKNFEVDSSKYKNSFSLEEKVSNKFLKLIDDDKLKKYDKDISEVVNEIKKEKNKIGFENQSDNVKSMVKNLFDKVIKDDPYIKDNIKSINDKNFERDLHSELFASLPVNDRQENKKIPSEELKNEKDTLKENILNELLKITSNDKFVDLHKNELSNLISKEPGNSAAVLFQSVVNSNEYIKENLSKLNDKIFEKEIVDKVFTNEKSKHEEVKTHLVDGASKLKKEYILNENVKVKYKDFPEKNKEEIKRNVKGILFELANTLYDNSQSRENEIRHRGLRRSRINKNVIKTVNLKKTRPNRNTLGM